MSTKLKIFNYWLICNTIGNAFQAISSAVVLIAILSEGRGQNILIGDVTLGLSALFTWIQLLQYFEHWNGMVLMHDILHRAATSMYIWFGLVLPLFIGCSILGIPYSLCHHLFSLCILLEVRCI